MNKLFLADKVRLCDVPCLRPLKDECFAPLFLWCFILMVDKQNKALLDNLTAERFNRCKLETVYKIVPAKINNIYLSAGQFKFMIAHGETD